MTWLGAKLWLLALGFRLRLGAGLCTRVILLVFLRRYCRAHRVGIDDDASANRAGNRRAGLVAIHAILSKMGGGDDLVARRAGPRDAERTFIMVEAVIEARLARHGALRRHAAVRRRNENEAEDGGRPRDSRRNAGKACKRFRAERAEDRAFGPTPAAASVPLAAARLGASA